MQHARFRVLFELAPLCMYEVGADRRLLAMNPAGLALLGVDREDEIRGRDYLDFVSLNDRDMVGRRIADAFAGRSSELEFSSAGTGPPRHFTCCFIPCADLHGNVDRLIGIAQDISLHQQTEADLRLLNRNHALLSRCNHSLARALVERDLANAFCDNLVEVGGYCFAWVGYSGAKRPPRIRMVAHAQQGDDDFAATALAWANTGEPPSACRRAIETRTAVVLRDSADEPNLAAWVDAARRRGYRSMVALPLMADATPFGNLSIFSPELDAFDKPELEQLVQLARDLAFGIQTIRARAAEAQRVRRLRDDVEQDARKRIAAILHDSVGQSMQAVNLGLKRMRAMTEQYARVPMELLDQLIAEVGAAIGELRDISHELRPLFLERLPLLDAVRFHCSETGARAGVSIRVVADDLSFHLDDRAKEQCFLGFREALSNAIRHGNASQVDVIFAIPSPGRLTLSIVDDGVGFDTAGAFRKPTGLGLCMIRERAESVLGHARIHSIPGHGTRVQICVPLAKESPPCL
jgi:PAS domain S-box-containing protein